MAAVKLLANFFKKLQNDPIEGILTELEDDSNLFDWTIWVEGPKDTLYEGGVFKMKMSFPQDFPMSPPELKFLSDFWHPNVYGDSGVVCISILHPPGEDEMSGERADERWLPTQSISSILLSVISLLNQPNFSSPANVDASVEWQKHPEQYTKKIKQLVEKSKREKPPQLVIPHPETNPTEKKKMIAKIKQQNTTTMEEDFLNDDMMYDSAEEEEGEEDEKEEKEEKEGTKPAASGFSSKSTVENPKKAEDLKFQAKAKKKKKRCLIM
jgi:ubiquitin-conjugating enzyme E2 R